MANTFITPSVIANRALATLYNTTVLAALVYRDYDPDFTGKQGDTITVRTPAVFEGKTFDRDNGIDVQEVTEDSFPVSLNDIVDVSFEVTTEQLTLEVDDFATRILDPAMEAIVQSIDGSLADELATAATETATAESDPHTAFTGKEGALALLGRAKAPRTNRFVVFSPEAEGVALGDDLFVSAEKAGATDGLRNAAVGRVFGFDTYGTQTLGDGGRPHAIAAHRDAVALVSRTLALPMGADGSRAAVASYKGFGLRVVKDYDISKKQDVVSVDTLVGYQGLREDMAVELDLGIEGS